MQSSEHKAHWEKWSGEMASDAAPGGKIDVGPVEVLTTKAGNRTPTRDKRRGRVPAFSSGQQKKL